MKKLISTTLILTSIATSSLVQAEEKKPTYTEAKQSATFITSVVAGTVAAGPVGFIIGALGGAYWGEQIKQADEADMMGESLAVANNTIDKLTQEIIISKNESRNLQALAFESLSLPVLFQTGSDTLSERGHQHIYSLARFLHTFPQYHVELNGHTDPRGTDEYNNVLSKARADAVKSALEIAGVNTHRIAVNAKGSAQSSANKGDLMAYAQERRVDIDLVLADKNGLVMN